MSRNFQLTRETKGLLREHTDFFDSIKDLTTELGLGLMGGDAEAHTEVSVQSDGDVEVTFVYPIDNNKDSTDGRIYLKDRFVFDPKEEKLKEYARQFDSKGDQSWKEWLERYRATSKDTPADSLDPALREKAILIGRSFARPIEDSLNAALKANSAYLLPAAQAAANMNPKWKLKVGDPQSHYTLVTRGKYLEISVALPVDDDKEAANGRIFFYDKFTYNTETKQLEKVERDWRVAPGVEEAQQAALKTAVAQLNLQPPPNLADAKTFLDGILPEVRKPLQLKSETGVPGLPIPPRPDPLPPKAFPSSWTKHKKHREVGPDGQKEFQFIQTVLAKESAAKLADKRAGWAHPLNKALLGEGDAGTRLETRLKSICANPDADVRARELVQFARQDLAIDGDYPETAFAVATLLKDHASVQEDVKKVVALLQGTGTVGQKFEFLVPRFAKETGDPAMLAAMAAAPFLGVTAESGILALSQKGSRLGVGLSRAGGVLFEAAGFTLSHRVLTAASHDPSKVLDPIAILKETAGASLLFGFTRLAHRATHALTGEMAKGRWGSWAVESSPQFTFLSSPAGRIGITPVYGATLSGWGEGLSNLLHHSAGIGAMFMAGQISQGLEWTPKNKQGLSGSLFDAAYMYAHAMVGFNMANRFTDGHLQAGLAEARMRVDGKTELPPVPFVLDPKTDAVGKGLGNWITEKVAADKLGTLRQNLHDTKNDLKTAREERDQKKAENADLSQKVIDLESSNNEKTRANADLSQANRELTTEKGELSRQLRDSERTVTELQEKITGHENDAREADRQLKDKEREIDTLREQVSREMSRALREKSAHELADQSLEQQRKAFEKLQEGFEKLGRGESIPEAIKSFQESLDAANTQVELLRGELGKKRAEIEDLQGRLDAANKSLAEARRDLENVRRDMSELRTEHSQVKSRLSIEETRAGTEKERAENAESLSEERRVEIEQLQARNAELDRDLIEANEKYADAERRVTEHWEKIQALQGQVDAFQSGLSEAMTEVSNQLEAANREKQELTEKVAELTRDLDLKERAINAQDLKHGESSRLQQVFLTEADNKNRRLEGELSDARAELETLRNVSIRNAELTGRIAALEDHIRSLEGQVGELDGEFESRETIPAPRPRSDVDDQDPEGERPTNPGIALRDIPGPQPPLVPAVRKAPTPLQVLSQEEVTQKILDLVRPAAQRGSVLATDVTNPVAEVTVALDPKKLDYAQEGDRVRLVLTLQVDRARKIIVLNENEKAGLISKMNQGNALVKKFITAVLSLDGVSLYDPQEGAPTDPQMQVQAVPVIPVPPIVPLHSPADATPVAGVDSPPSAHAESAGVTPAGAEVTIERYDEEDDDKKPTGKLPALQAEPEEFADTGDAVLFFEPAEFPAPQLDMSEVRQVGPMAEFAKTQVRLGEKTDSGSPALREWIHEFGDLTAVTDEGIGYKDSNEDALGRTLAPDGTLIIFNVDGAGGEANGRKAAHDSIEQLTVQTAAGLSVPDALTHTNDYVKRSVPGGGATAVATRIIRSHTHAGLYAAQPFWAGDSSILILRFQNGKWELLFRTKEDNYGREIIDANPEPDFSEMGRTLQIAVHPLANRVPNAIGAPSPFQVHTLADGQIYPLSEVIKLADNTDALLLKKGDAVVKYSDGLGDNITKVNKFLDLIKDAKSSEEIVSIGHRFALEKMHILAEVRGEIERQYAALRMGAFQSIDGGTLAVAQIRGGERRPFTWDGKELFVDTNGDIWHAENAPETYQSLIRVPVEYDGQTIYLEHSGIAWDSPEGGKPVDHFKCDNFGMSAIVLGGRVPSTPPPVPGRRSSPVPPPPVRRSSSIPPAPAAPVLPKPPTPRGRPALQGVLPPPTPPPQRRPSPPPFPGTPGAVPPSAASLLAATPAPRHATAELPPLPQVPPPRADYFTNRIWRLDPTRLPIIFGRRPEEGGVTINDVKVSAKHFRVNWHLGFFEVEDLRSDLGTSHNQVRIAPNRPARLQDGDWIRIGLLYEYQVHLRPDGTALLAVPYQFAFPRVVAGYSVGAHQNATHPLFDAAAAEYHLQIAFNGQSYQVRDTGQGPSGTLLNGVQIKNSAGPQAGTWWPLKAGDSLQIGQTFLQAGFTTQGELTLKQVQKPPQEALETPEMARAKAEMEESRRANLPSSPRKDPRIHGENLEMGNAKTILVRETRKDPGLYLDDRDSRTYTLSLKQVMMFESDLAKIEETSAGIYKVTNLGLPELKITNAAKGRTFTVVQGRTEQALFDDRLTFGKLTALVLKP